VGIACEARDLLGAKAVAGLIDQLGVRAQYPAFDTAASITEKLQALRTTITQSHALLCYWAKAEGKGLEKRLEQDARRRVDEPVLFAVAGLPVDAEAGQCGQKVLRHFQEVDVVLPERVVRIEQQSERACLHWHGVCARSL